jgi:sterol 3beta-glucosyltransferase
MITILCGGSRGDVQPYLALAIELKRMGKEVRIAVTRNHEEFVRSYGIDFFSIDVDFESLKVDKNMIREAQQADNPLKLFFSFQKMKKYGVHMVEHYYAACEGSEAIVYHPGMAIGYYAAEKLGIPSILATPFPLNKTKEQTAVILYGKVPSNPGVNLFSYTILQSMLWMASDASLKPFCLLIMVVHSKGTLIDDIQQLFLAVILFFPGQLIGMKIFTRMVTGSWKNRMNTPHQWN